jgi:DNA invertase Pin-like site-specific DNA recombinase
LIFALGENRPINGVDRKKIVLDESLLSQRRRGEFAQRWSATAAKKTALQKSRYLHGSAGGEAMTTYGYGRVSSHGQDLEIQLAELRAAGCEKIFCEKESGTKDDRRQLRRLLKILKAGDVVIVSALDRFTRGGAFKTLCILDAITSRGATYKSLAEPLPDADELGEVIAALYGYVARKNRLDLLRRTAAGRARAKAMGVKFGRRPKLSPAQQQQARARRSAGEPPARIASDFNVSSSTIARLGP